MDTGWAHILYFDCAIVTKGDCHGDLTLSLCLPPLPSLCLLSPPPSLCPSLSSSLSHFLINV